MNRTILSLVLSKTSDKKKTSKSNGRKQTIIDYLTNNKLGKTGDISEHIGISLARARAYLQELIADGTIIAEGANRNKTYRLN